MKNLIKMDFYRLFHTRALKVGIVAALLVSAAAAFLNLGVIELMKVALATDPNVAATLTLAFPAAAWLEGADFADIIITGTGAFSLLISCMVASSFISAEQSCGYVKNVIGQLNDRSYTVISKFVVTSSIYLIMLAVYTLVNSVIANIFFDEYIVSYSIVTMIGALATRFLLFCAINAIIVFLCTLTKSQSLAMVIGAIFGIGITQIVYFLGNSLLRLMNINVTISKFMPDGVNGMISADSIGSVYVRAIGVSAVFIVIFIGGSIAIVKNRDVR